MKIKKLVLLTLVVFVILGCNLPTLAVKNATQPTATPYGSATTQPPPSPTVTETIESTPTPSPTNTPLPTTTPTSIPTFTPIPTLTPTPIVLPTTHVVEEGETLYSISNHYGVPVYLIALVNNLSDPDLIYVGQVLNIPDPNDISDAHEYTPTDEKEILVDLSMQRVFAYQDGELLNTFIAATGKPGYETVLGVYHIYLKYEDTSMTGPDYYLPHVPWTMYFYQGYGLHGAPWNQNLGQPGSHGCVNLSVEDAKWLFEWAEIGTTVIVQP